MKALAIALVALVVLASPAVGAAGGLYNGDFEIQGPQRSDTRVPAGYTGGGAGSMARVASGTDGVPAYSGSWLVRLSVPPGYAAAQVFNPRPFAVPGPGAYTLRVALRSGGSQARAVVGYAYRDAAFRPIAGASGELVVTPPSGTWAMYTLPANAPAGAAYISVSVRNSLQPSPPSVSSLYVDALDVVPAAALKH